VYGRILKERLPQVPRDIATSKDPPESWPLLPLLPPTLSERLIGRWSNLLDTGPLARTLSQKWGIDKDRLAASAMTLLISATNVQTGELTVFSNKPIAKYETGEAREDVKVGIDVNRILASCSIPLVYPWTEDDGAHFWDGAVVANTPLGPALDAAAQNHDLTEPMEVAVVLMTPWWEKGEVPPSRKELPSDFGEAITWTLDWALLSSFRADLKITRHFNERAALDIEAGRAPRYRQVNTRIIAPEDFLPVSRIIDYDLKESSELIEAGEAAAKAAFEGEAV
jgi:NTE family protein